MMNVRACDSLVSSNFYIEDIIQVEPPYKFEIRKFIGGTNEHINSNITQYNTSHFLIYGNDGKGLYLMEMNKFNYSISREAKLTLNYPMTQRTAIVLFNLRIILFGTI